MGKITENVKAGIERIMQGPEHTDPLPRTPEDKLREYYWSHKNQMLELDADLHCLVAHGEFMFLEPATGEGVSSDLWEPALSVRYDRHSETELLVILFNEGREADISCLEPEVVPEVLQILTTHARPCRSVADEQSVAA